MNLEEGWLGGKDVPQLSAGDPATWAWESHQQAVNIAYGKLPEILVLDDAITTRQSPPWINSSQLADFASPAF